MINYLTTFEFVIYELLILFVDYILGLLIIIIIGKFVLVVYEFLTILNNDFIEL